MLLRVATPYETMLHVRVKLPERGGLCKEANVVEPDLLCLTIIEFLMCPAFLPYFYIH